MPEYANDIKSALRALQALPAAQRKPAEVTAFYFPAPDGTQVYAAAGYDQLPGYEGLRAALISRLGTDGTILVKLIPTSNTPFSQLPRTAAVADDSADFTLSDLDGEISRLVTTYGEGVRAEVFGYWPTVDLLLSLWRGLTKVPKEMSAEQVKLSCSTGIRNPSLNIPRRSHATSCLFIFGALLNSQEEIDYHKGCPYNAHLGGSVGVPGFVSCPRAQVSDCTTRLVTKNYWPGFDVRPDPIANYVRGRNIPASAVGNASNLADPVRVVIGSRYVKALPLLEYRNEVNTAHPDKGFGAGLFEVCEGPIRSLWNFYINGVFITSEHLNFRYGREGESPTFFSPNVNPFARTAQAYGRVQGSFNENQAASLTGAINAEGLSNIRAYTDEASYTEQYTTNRLWAILECLANPRWGLGNHYSRYDIPSAIYAAQKCDEVVSMHDPNGNLFTGPRSTCNVELTGRSITQQIGDLCVAGRIGIPFEFQGKDVFVPLVKEDLTDPQIPTFTDEGSDRNIIYDGSKSSLTWSQASDSELPNQWTVNFDDASNGGVETHLIFADQRQQLRAGRAYGDSSIRVVNKDQPAFGVNNFSEAARLGNLLLYLGPLDQGGVASNWRVKFTTWYAESLFVQMYKPIRVLNAKMQRLILLYFTQLAADNPNLSYFAGQPYEYFRVMKITRKGDLKVDIEAQVYPQDYYERIEDVEQTPPIFVAPPIVNPGGRRHQQPEPIALTSIAHAGDRMTGRFAPSVY
jgi:hypothetical protein